jgi:hypothetical protein
MKRLSKMNRKTINTTKEFAKPTTGPSSATDEQATNHRSAPHAEVNGAHHQHQPDFEPREQVISREPGSSKFQGEPTAEHKTQWGVGMRDRMPTINMGMPADMLARLTEAAKTAALTGQARTEVEVYAAQLFDAVWEDFKGVFLAKISGAKRELARLEGERGDIVKASANLPPIICTSPGRFQLPTGLKLGWFVLLILAIVMVLGSEWASAASLRRFELQSLGLALLVTTPLLSFGIVSKILLNEDENFKGKTFRAIFHVVGVLGVVGWLICFALCYGTALREDHQLASKTVVIAFTLAQFIAAIAASSWLGHMASQLVDKVGSFDIDPSYRLIVDQLEKIDNKMATEETIVLIQEGNVSTYYKSRASFTQLGLSTFHRTKAMVDLLTNN